MLLDDQRRALRALREPSPEMVWAMCKINRAVLTYGPCLECKPNDECDDRAMDLDSWHAAVDAALEQGGDGEA